VQRFSTPAPYSAAPYSPPPYSTVQPVAKPSAGRRLLIVLAILSAIPIVIGGLLVAFFAIRAIASSAPAPPAAASGTTALPSVEAPTTASAPPTTTVPGRPPRPTPTGPFTVTPPAPTPAPTVTFQGGGDAPPFVPREFPRDRANQRFDQALTTIQNCHAPGDPTGSSVVDLTWEGDGRVGVTVRPPFASTETGQCISARLLGLRGSVGRFVNGPVTLQRIVTIR
jgi:hypothetical protein